MERPSRLTFEPSSNIGMLMGGVVVGFEAYRMVAAGATGRIVLRAQD